MEDVEVSKLELPDDEMKSQKFGKSLMIEEALGPFIQMKTLLRDQVCLLGKEIVPKPEPDEAVILKDYFTVGLQFPVEDLVKDILDAYNIELHHLMPNGL